MDTDEGPLINENSNGLSHLLTEGEFSSVDAGVVDESSISNQAFLNAVELSAGSVGDYLENNTTGFNGDSFDVGDNAVTFPSDALENELADGDSLLSDAPIYKYSETSTDPTERVIDTDCEHTNENSVTDPTSCVIQNQEITDSECDVQNEEITDSVCVIQNEEITDTEIKSIINEVVDQKVLIDTECNTLEMEHEAGAVTIENKESSNENAKV